MTDLDQQIADVERDIESARACLKRISLRDPLMLRVAKAISALQAKHEQIVRQVQWATLGAAKAGRGAVMARPHLQPLQVAFLSLCEITKSAALTGTEAGAVVAELCCSAAGVTARDARRRVLRAVRPLVVLGLLDRRRIPTVAGGGRVHYGDAAWGFDHRLSALGLRRLTEDTSEFPALAEIRARVRSLAVSADYCEYLNLSARPEVAS